jgi:hypothetical protein
LLALTAQPPGLAIGPGTELPHRPVPVTILEATENASGVVARSDVDAVPGDAGQDSGPILRPWWRHDGSVSEVDDDQLAALRRLRAAFGFVEIIEVISHDPGDEPTTPLGEPIEGAAMADPRRMTPEEREQAHALLARAVSDSDWEAASQALDDLMRKLLVVHRLLEAEERLAEREPRRNG